MSWTDESQLFFTEGNTFLADNFHWDNDSYYAEKIEEIISGSQYPIYPDSISAIVCNKGSFSIQTKGENIEAHPLDAMVILGGEVIEHISISPDCRLFYFSGKMESIGSQMDLDDVNHILRYAISVHQPMVFHLETREYMAVEKLYMSAKELLSISPDYIHENIISGYARIISSLIAGKIGNTAISEESAAGISNRTLLADFLANVHANCRKERSISFYAEKANLTPKYFSRVIKNVSGQTPGSIIREYTMAEAKALLATKKYSVKEISTMLNFSGPASFGKYFKASQGCPPGDYLRSISEKH